MGLWVKLKSADAVWVRLMFADTMVQFVLYCVSVDSAIWSYSLAGCKQCGEERDSCCLVASYHIHKLTEVWYKQENCRSQRETRISQLGPKTVWHSEGRRRWFASGMRLWTMKYRVWSALRLCGIF